jgi:hypothetical protein
VLAHCTSLGLAMLPTHNYNSHRRKRYENEKKKKKERNKKWVPLRS